MQKQIPLIIEKMGSQRSIEHEIKERIVGQISYETGICEDCGNFSYRLRLDDDGSFRCEDCLRGTGEKEKP